MAQLPRQIFLHMRRLVTPRSMAAALPDWILAAAFLVILKGEILGSVVKLPGIRVFYAWFLFEIAAIWAVPALYWIFKVWGPRAITVLVCNVIPTTIAVLLASGFLADSATLLVPAYVLLFVYNKCLSFYCSSASHEMREAFIVRVVVGASTWIFSVILSALIFVFIFTPLELQEENRLVPSTMILSACLYFIILGILELVMAAQPPRDEYEDYLHEMASRG